MKSTWGRISIALKPRTGLSSLATGSESTLESRLASLNYSIQLSRTKPLTGFGFDFSSQIVPYLQFQPHNNLILSFQSGGLLFLLIELVFTFFCLISIVRSLKSGDFLTFSLVFVPLATMFTNPIISNPTLLSPLFLGIIVQKRAADGDTLRNR